MKIEEIYELGEEVKRFDISDLENESLRTTDLYIKVLKVHSMESLVLRQKEDALNIAYKNAHSYYSGRSNKPYEFIVDKSDMKTYINADDDYIEVKKKYLLQEEKVKYLEKLLNGVKDRTWQARNAIEFLKFQNGQ